MQSASEFCVHSNSLSLRTSRSEQSASDSNKTLGKHERLKIFSDDLLTAISCGTCPAATEAGREGTCPASTEAGREGTCPAATEAAREGFA